MTQDAFFGDDVKIYIDKDSATAGSFAAADAIETSLLNFNMSGGEFEQETQPLLGNANIVIEKPQTEFEISMDVVVKPTDATFWDEIFYGSGLTSATRGNSVTVGLQATDGTNKYQKLFKNVKAVSFEQSIENGEYLQGTMTLKLAPTDSSGSANISVGSAVFTVSS